MCSLNGRSIFSTEEAVVISRIADEVALGKRDVEYRGVIVDELQEVNLERESVVVLGLRPVQLEIGQPPCHVLVDLQQPTVLH